MGGGVTFSTSKDTKPINVPPRRKSMKEEDKNEAGPVEGSKEHVMDVVIMATRKRPFGKMIEISQRGSIGTRRPGRKT